MQGNDLYKGLFLLLEISDILRIYVNLVLIKVQLTKYIVFGFPHIAQDSSFFSQICTWPHFEFNPNSAV